jgi:hypothetical protein
MSSTRKEVAEVSGGRGRVSFELLYTNLLGVNCYLLSWEVHSHAGVLADDIAIVVAGNSKARCKTWLPREVWEC